MRTMSGRRRSKQSLGAELRDAVFRLSVMTGGFLALLYGVSHAPKAKPCPVHHGVHHGGAVGRCVSGPLSEILVPWAIIIGVGLVAGAAVGLLLARLIPVRSRPKARAGRTSRAAIPEKVRHAVWRRDGGNCVECGTNENLEFDHIIPVSRGGANTERNLQLLCAQCNGRKAAHV
jgi:hypothetical protein